MILGMIFTEMDSICYIWMCECHTNFKTIVVFFYQSKKKQVKRKTVREKLQQEKLSTLFFSEIKKINKKMNSIRFLLFIKVL